MGHKIFICSSSPKKMLDDQFLKSYFDGYILFNGGYVEVEGQSIFVKDVQRCLRQNFIEMMFYIVQLNENVTIQIKMLKK